MLTVNQSCEILWIVYRSVLSSSLEILVSVYHNLLVTKNKLANQTPAIVDDSVNELLIL